MAKHDFQHVPERVRYRQNAACRAQPPDRTRLLSSMNGQSRAEDRATLSALVSFSRDAGDFPTALDYAERLTRIMPNDPNLRTLIESLRAQVTKSGAP